MHPFVTGLFPSTDAGQVHPHCVLCQGSSLSRAEERVSRIRHLHPSAAGPSAAPASWPSWGGCCGRGCADKSSRARFASWSCAHAEAGLLSQKMILFFMILRNPRCFQGGSGGWMFPPTGGRVPVSLLPHQPAASGSDSGRPDAWKVVALWVPTHCLSTLDLRFHSACKQGCRRVPRSSESRAALRRADGESLPLPLGAPGGRWLSPGPTDGGGGPALGPCQEVGGTRGPRVCQLP